MGGNSRGTREKIMKVKHKYLPKHSSKRKRDNSTTIFSRRYTSEFWRAK